MVQPFSGEADKTKVQIALADMFASFRSMRQTGDEAMAVLESVARSLAPFPRWAIEKACLAVQTNGVWRKGAFDTQWPPNDSEIVKEVRDQLRLYGDTYRSAVDLLTAEVES